MPGRHSTISNPVIFLLTKRELEGWITTGNVESQTHSIIELEERERCFRGRKLRS